MGNDPGTTINNPISYDDIITLAKSLLANN